MFSRSRVSWFGEFSLKIKVTSIRPRTNTFHYQIRMSPGFDLPYRPISGYLKKSASKDRGEDLRIVLKTLVRVCVGGLKIFEDDSVFSQYSRKISRQLLAENLSNSLAGEDFALIMIKKRKQLWFILEAFQNPIVLTVSLGSSFFV